jgi:hypothetical protein
MGDRGQKEEKAARWGSSDKIFGLSPVGPSPLPTSASLHTWAQASIFFQRSSPKALPLCERERTEGGDPLT